MRVTKNNLLLLYQKQTQKRRKTMKTVNTNVTKWSLLSLGLIGVLSSLILIYTPTVDAFGAAEASCANGTTVSCSGYSCTETTNVGCSCKDAQGTVVDHKSCPKGDEFMVIETDQ